MIKCGLLGEKLGHSYSPQIHSMLGDYEYTLFEKQENELEDFIFNGDWNGINVTIPYKKQVIPYLDILGETAKKAGSVNTVVRTDEGKLFGDNTDVYGFVKMVEHSKVDVKNRKVLVLGSGGASVAVVTALKELKANPVVISRTGTNNYNNLEQHYDATIIVNTTPVGMYPNVDETLLDISIFPNLEGVLDIIYNPSYTGLLLQAQKMGLKVENGLYMLVAQAKKSAELFMNRQLDDEIIDSIYNKLAYEMKNIVLIGMPGAGKTTVAQTIAKITGRNVVDTDCEIRKRCKMTPKELIIEKGEEAFRIIETEILKEIGKQSGLVIATGGGIVTREENYGYLHQNANIVWLLRNLEKLDSNDRPLSQSVGVASLYEQREPLYRRFADYTVDNEEDVNIVAEKIISMIER